MGSGAGMRVRFADAPGAKVSRAQPPPALDAALKAVRAASSFGAAPGAVRLQLSCQRFGDVHVQFCLEAPAPPPPRRRSAVVSEETALDAAQIAALRRATARAASAATTLGCRAVRYPADITAFLRDRTTYECRSPAAAQEGRDRRRRQREAVRALARRARAPPSPSPERRRAPPRQLGAADVFEAEPDATCGGVEASEPGDGGTVVQEPRDLEAAADDDCVSASAGGAAANKPTSSASDVGASASKPVGAATSSNADETPTAPDAVASPPPSARPDRSLPTPTLIGDLEAALGAPLRPARPTPKRILRRDDTPVGLAAAMTAAAPLRRGEEQLRPPCAEPAPAAAAPAPAVKKGRKGKRRTTTCSYCRRGGCRNGDACPFSHADAGAAAAPKDAAAAPRRTPPRPPPPTSDYEPVVDLADLLRAARLPEFERVFAAEKVKMNDLVEARAAGDEDLRELLAECGLKAGERARLKRELAKRWPR